ncbi:MAG: chromate transporter [Thermotogaceae bacterium]|nr:chromate transporter [Thermotogaceae bacterium]RKX41602.1 MAG: chromate transporter [Thermotogota bacterium]RKX52742.1 MAG: chromate transporter [Thermotoga sp.]RKX57457.1 MAG: chromate transporter [Thermotoga sp.]
MLKLALSLMKVSIMGLGGGYGMLPLIEEELVRKLKILKEDEFLDIVAKAQSFPGPIAVNTAILLGRMKAGILGSIICSISIVLPPFLSILLIALMFEKVEKYSIVRNFMFGARLGVTIIIINYSLELIKKMVKNRVILVILIAGAVVIVFFKISAFLVFLVVATVVFFKVTNREEKQ